MTTSHKGQWRFRHDGVVRSTKYTGCLQLELLYNCSDKKNDQSWLLMTSEYHFYLEEGITYWYFEMLNLKYNLKILPKSENLYSSGKSYDCNIHRIVFKRRKIQWN